MLWGTIGGQWMGASLFAPSGSPIDLGKANALPALPLRGSRRDREARHPCGLSAIGPQYFCSSAGRCAGHSPQARLPGTA